MTEPAAATRAAARAWGVALVERTSARYSDTWFARRGDEHVVLKTGEPAARRREAAALTAYRSVPGAAAPLLAVTDGALLVARVLPGDDIRPLAAIDDDAALCQIGATIARLHQAARGDAALRLPPLAEIAEAFDRYGSSRSTALPPDLVDRAAGMARELTAATGDDVVLHGDLHHQNLLRSAAGAEVSWVAIDPHGWFGDPAFDAAAALLNPYEAIAQARDPGGFTRRRAALLAEAGGLDRERVTAWAFTGAVISELWHLEDHGFVAGAALRLATALTLT